MPEPQRKKRRKIGTFEHLSDGRVRVTVVHGTRLDGRLRRLSGIAESEEDAERVALELAAQLGRRPDLGRGLTLRRWWDAYSVGKGNRIVRGTYKRYKGDMERVWLPEMGNTDISLISRVEVQRILLSLPTRPAAQHAKSTLSAVLTQAVREGYLAENPIRNGGFELPGDVGTRDFGDEDYDDDPFAAIEGRSDVWDARTVMRAMPLLEDTPLETCWLCMVGAGLRREEALALRWKDVRRIEVAGHEVTQIAVHHARTEEDGLKRTKTRRSIRIVAMVEPFGSRLWSLCGEANALVCDVPMSNIRRNWMKLFQHVTSKHAPKSGVLKGRLADLPYIPLSRMRATHETFMQQAGVLDSINAATHGHSERISYSNYQRPDTAAAALQAGNFLLVEGGRHEGCIDSQAK
ncbi:MAG: hypothetical protein J6D54_07155 [Olsenella sp.]|nr:hypothetical protein [Olsenella sp.]